MYEGVDLEHPDTTNTMKDKVSLVEIGVYKRLKVLKSILADKAKTYKFIYTCKDKYNAERIEFPFRVVVIDGNVSPTSED